MDSVEAKRVELHAATRRYLDGEITTDEWRAVRDRCMPDYDAMGRHLYAVSQRAQREQRMMKRPRSLIEKYPRAAVLTILLGGLALMVFFLLTAE